MTKLNKLQLRKLILKEVKKVEEDSLLTKHKTGHDHRALKNMLCNECGSLVYEGQSECERCGYSKHEELTRKEYNRNLSEGSCECGTCATCSSIDYKEDFNTDAIVDKHHHGAYMSKSHLYKTAKYAQKLYEMVPTDLEDWMRSKLAQIADDISEVYHALDYDKHKGDI
jgi:hypothetical protein